MHLLPHPPQQPEIVVHQVWNDAIPATSKIHVSHVDITLRIGLWKPKLCMAIGSNQLVLYIQSEAEFKESSIAFSSFT